MKNKRFSDVVLVYDRYYAKKPNPVLLAAKRVGLCCVICVCAMMFVLSEYALDVNLIACGVISALFGATFSMLFIFVKKRIAIPSILVLFGLVAWLTFKSFSEKISYFLDAMCMVMNGRFISGKILVSHTLYQLVPENEEYVQGVMFGVVLLIMLFSMVTAAGMFSKPHYLPSFLFWVALWVPVFISERFTFNIWLIPSLAVYMGAFAVSLTYTQGLALKSGKNGVYRSSTMLSENSFKNSLAKVPYIKRIGMMSTHYSKYFSVTMYAASIFAVIGILSSAVLADSTGVDYTKLYDFVVKLGETAATNTPTVDTGPINDYFTNFDTSTKLSITSPGNSEMEVLKVVNNGSRSVYLRGDYGINFFGEQWTSPVHNEPYVWKGLKKYYRPAEVRVLRELLADEYDYGNPVEKIDLTVDYLADSKTVFLPAYTENFNYYENNQFDTYGDFVVRVNSRYHKVNTIECTAMIPAYTNQDDYTSDEAVLFVKNALNAVNNVDFNGIMDVVMEKRKFTDYKSYVYSTFCTSPEDKALINALDEFISESKLGVEISDIRRDWELSELEERYKIAGVVCGYLKKNYTYSLSNENTGNDAIQKFLNENKRGHCALFATSMTLLLRRLNIPARYVTGFVAPPTGSTATILRSKNLHAWCEVYMDELGWVTFDPTSAAAYGNVPSNSTNSNMSSTSSRPVNSSNASSESEPVSSASQNESSRTEDSEDDPLSEDESGDSDTEHRSAADSEENSGVNALPYILVILIAAAVAAGIWFVVKWYKALEARAAKAVRRVCRERNAEVLLEKIILLLQIGGLTPKAGELPDKFYTRAERTLRCAFSTNKDLLKAVAFGSASIPKTECEGLARLYEQLFNALNKKMDAFDRIKLWKSVL